jgi:hypothetical protein
MNSKFILLCAAAVLSGCNHIRLKPETMDRGQIVYTNRGGYGMRRAAKEIFEERGYTVLVGRARSFSSLDDSAGGDMDFDTSSVPSNARYAVKVQEREETFAPVWCFFNGFWWWNFNVSIADQKTGEELLAWSGRGCAHSSLLKLRGVLDKIEIPGSD